MNHSHTLHASDRRMLTMLATAAGLLAIMLLWQLAGGARTPEVEVKARAFRPPTTEATVADLRARLQESPDNADLYALLGVALLQQVRETNDPALYGQAQSALDTALALDPHQLDALVGQGNLALARHDFTAALEWGHKAHDGMPYRADALGVLVDGYVELGRYDEAVAAAQAMVDLRPDLASYSRVSYLREIHGDTDGAVAAMRAAVEAGPPYSEATAWAQVQLGNLYFNGGDRSRAAMTYQDALRTLPDYPHALAGLARLQALAGNIDGAIATYTTIVSRLPLPEFAVTLGQLHELAGQTERAREQYDLVRAMQQLNAATGMDVDLEMALFEADHGDPSKALEMAEAAYRRRPTIYAEDILAWAHYRNGNYAEAQRYMDRALRLNTQDARMFFHQGMIAAARGESGRATTFLQAALNLNPHFDLLQAPLAEATLAHLQRTVK